MEPVTQEFMDAIKAGRRNIKARIEVTWTDPQLDESIQISTTEKTRISWEKQVADSIETVPQKYAAFDGSWKLDGTYYLAPDTEEEAEIKQMGWWSRYLSNSATGEFSQPYPQLNITFLPRPIWSLKVVGDSAREEYPVEFDIKIYNSSGALVHTESVTDNDSVSWQKDITEENLLSITRMELIIKKWSHGSKHAKITEFFTSIQEVYDDDEIIYLNLLEERDVSQGTLPIGNISSNEIDIRLLNIDNRFHAGNIKSPLYQKVKTNRKIRAWLGIELPEGVVEYIPLGTFWSGDWSVPEEEIYASTNARDRLELMRETDFSSSEVYMNKSLYELAIIVLEDYGLNNSQYFVDTELQEYVIPYAFFDDVSHREALKQIVSACMGQCYADRKDIVRVEGPSFIQLPE